jgi:hypothetical protein
MGAYNTLRVSVKCKFCLNYYRSKLQFKIGEVWQHEYQVGDQIKWDDDILPRKTIMAYGILEDEICPICKKNNEAEYDILIENGEIRNYALAKNVALYLRNEEGNYYILE